MSVSIHAGKHLSSLLSIPLHGLHHHHLPRHLQVSHIYLYTIKTINLYDKL